MPANWHDLFLATSPSRTTDKANVLLVGPMGCLTGDTFIQYEVKTKNGKRVNHKGGTIERLYQRYNNLPKKHAGPKQRTDVEYYAPSINDERRVFQNKINGVIYTGEKECFELKTKGDKTVKATADHEFFVGDKYQRLDELKAGDSVFVHNKTYYEDENDKTKKTYRLNRRSYVHVKQHPVCGNKKVGKYEYKRLARARAIVEAQLNGLTYNDYIAKLNSDEEISNLEFLSRDANVHHKDENILNDEISNLEVINIAEHSRQHGAENTNVRYIVVEDEIESITPVGVKKVYDVQMAHPYHNVIADDIVVHNCGKTEIFRAVGADTKSISVSVQGSDFNTCWKGEMEKNPKRMFEAGLKLQKESGKHVHFLIDEIDSVLNDDRSFGSSNLSLEFQILMDGVVNYPNVSVWGATNNPRRIPMPMMRRFSQVLIVGELNQDDRIKLLKHFVGFLPVEDLSDDVWGAAATRLEGATGDVVRKVADHIWRSKMSWFVYNHGEVAADLLEELRGDTQFQLKDFSSRERKKFNKKLGNHFKVGAEDVNESIDIHLNNIAIRSEIETAKKTYEDARNFLEELNASSIAVRRRYFSHSSNRLLDTARLELYDGW